MATNKQTIAVRPEDAHRLRTIAVHNRISMIDALTVLISQFEKEHGRDLNKLEIEKVVGVK